MYPRLSPRAWEPETIPVPGWASSAHPCFPSPVHCAFRIAPASLRCPRRAQAWKGDLKRKLRGLQATVFAKPRSCLATPQEVTVIVPEERRTRRSRLWGWRRKIAPARKVEAGCASRGPSFSGTRRRLEDRVRGSGAESSMAADPWPGSVKSPGDPAALGLVLPSSSYPAGNDTKLGSSPYFRDVPGRCVGERGLSLACVAPGPSRGSKGKARSLNCGYSRIN